MLKLAVLISGNGSNLQAIINSISNKELNAKILIVISNKASARGLKRAQQANIPTLVIEHESHSNPEDYDQALLTALQQYNINVIALAGFMRILTPKFVQAYPNKIINIHPSLLPKFKGLNTHQRALDAGEKEHGVSIHIVTEALDDGPILAQAQYRIARDDTAKSLQAKLQTIEHQIYPLVLQKIALKEIEL